jgi:hypothetical protein
MSVNNNFILAYSFDCRAAGQQAMHKHYNSLKYSSIHCQPVGVTRAKIEHA